MKISHLAELGYEILAINRANGWNVCTPADLIDGANPYKIPAVLALIASEITEFYEEVSADHPDYPHLSEELADVQIRTLGMAYGLGFDFASAAAGSSRDYTSPSRDTMENIARMHEFVSKALEAYRKGDILRVRDRLADLFALTQGVAGTFDGIDLDAAINEKLAKNRTREYCHGGKKV